MRVDDGEGFWHQLVAHRAQTRHGGQQSAAVRVLRRAEQCRGPAFLDLLALQHDNDPISRFRHNAHIMGDEDDGHALFFLQQFDQLENFGLNSHIQRCCRLVGNQQMRTASQTHGNHHPLAHPARQLVRIIIQPPRRTGNPHAFQNPQGFRARGLRVEPAMVFQSFADLEADGQHRIERGHRLLKNHRQFVAAQMAHLLFGQGQQVVAAEQDLAFGVAVGLRQQAHGRQSGDAFARTRFTHHRDGFTRADIEGQVLDHRAPFAIHPERGGQIADRQQRLRGHRRAHASPFNFGSMASRNPSPNRLSAKTTIKIAVPGASTSQ